MPDESRRGECQCCEYETDLTAYSAEVGPAPHLRVRREIWLCEVCASTPLSQAYERPDTVEDPGLYRALGWIANRILKEIRRAPQG
jgi:hypothetical protein